MNHADVVLSQAFSEGSRAALRMGPRTVTYAEIAAASAALAAGLRRAGVNTSDCVMMFAENTVEHLLIYHAAARCGAVFAPVHPAFKAVELAYAVGNCRPRLIITTEDLVALVEGALAQTGHSARIVLLTANSADLMAYADLASNPDGIADGDFPPEQPLLISYTSGTSSLPKPVLRSHGAESWSARTYRQAWGFEPDDRVLVAMSLSWVFGLSTLAQTALATGATIVLEQKFSPTRTLELMAGREVTAFAGTMSMYAMMLNVMRERDFDLSGVRKLFLGGEPRNEPVVAEMEARFGLRLCEGWAMTESFPVLAIHPVRDRQAPHASLGRLVEGVEMRLVDERGQEVADGQPGEALVRSPGGFLAYNEEPELTADRRAADGWLRSGDLLRRDADGYFTFVARKGEMIIRGGANLSPAEIESAICTCSDVADAIVVGLPDPVMGEMVVALFTTHNGCAIDAAALSAYLGDRIAKFKLPSLLFKVDAIPAGTTGKKNRTAARHVAIALHDASLVQGSPAS